MKLINPFRRKPADAKTTGAWRKWTTLPKRDGGAAKIHYAIVTKHPNSGMLGLVFGMSWHQHLLRDAVASAAASAAARCGANHTFYRPKARSVSTYGVARIASEDKRKFPRLVPAAIVFAESLKDKETASILLLDLRDVNGDGSLFMCMALRGDPIPDREFIGSETACVELLRKWANSASNGVHLLLDLHPGELRSSLQERHPSNEEYSLTDQVIGLHLDLKQVALLPFKKWHAVLVGTVLLATFGYDYGAKFYEQQIAKERAEAANQVAITSYLAARDSAYRQGYVSAWKEGFADAYSTMANETLVRKGWRFEQAICTIAERKCRLTWIRLYGTYTSFLDGLEPNNLEIDASDYTKVIETRSWLEHPVVQPKYEDLPIDRVFIKQNGDRKDTLLLSGFSKYDTGAITTLTPWAGQGVPPGPEMLSAAWSLEGGLDLLLDLSQSSHLSQEFSSKAITFTNAEGLLTVRLEGNIYVRKT